MHGKSLCSQGGMEVSAARRKALKCHKYHMTEFHVQPKERLVKVEIGALMRQEAAEEKKPQVTSARRKALNCHKYSTAVFNVQPKEWLAKMEIDGLSGQETTEGKKWKETMLSNLPLALVEMCSTWLPAVEVSHFRAAFRKASRLQAFLFHLVRESDVAQPVIFASWYRQKARGGSPISFEHGEHFALRSIATLARSLPHWYWRYPQLASEIIGGVRRYRFSDEPAVRSSAHAFLSSFYGRVWKCTEVPEDLNAALDFFASFPFEFPLSGTSVFFPHGGPVSHHPPHTFYPHPFYGFYLHPFHPPDPFFGGPFYSTPATAF